MSATSKRASRISTPPFHRDAPRSVFAHLYGAVVAAVLAATRLCAAAHRAQRRWCGNDPRSRHRRSDDPERAGCDGRCAWSWASCARPAAPAATARTRVPSHRRLRWRIHSHVLGHVPPNAVRALSTGHASGDVHAPTVVRAPSAGATSSVVTKATAGDEPPYILSARVTPSTVSSGTTVSAWLSTTHGVVAVTAYAGGSSLALHRIAAGQFAVATTLPPLPPYVSGIFPVTFVARDARGRTTQTAVNVSVR